MTTNMAQRGYVLLAGPAGRLRSVYRFLRRWPVISGGIVLLLATVAIFAPLISPHNPVEHDLKKRNMPPAWVEGGSVTYVLGTDTLGRDLLSRLIHGARVSMTVAVIALSSGIVIGTTLGMLAGYYGRFVDELVTRTVDVWMGIPFILVALVISLAMGASLLTIAILLAMMSWSPFVRQVRGLVLSLRTREYVLSAKVSGGSTAHIFLVHLLPGVSNIVIVIASFRVASLILAEALLSFLGAGIPPPTPSWGNMIADGREYLRDAWWIAVFPGVCIVLTTSAFAFLGDWIRDFTDPRLRQAG
ncbi:MAG: ABC transporter permease [Chloroflexota bacterium]